MSDTRVQAVVTRTRSPNVAGDIITLSAEEFAQAKELGWARELSEQEATESKTRTKAPKNTRG